jgi:2-dehydro-3-deoxyphosphogluconate aldolase/(4S)-4-hydroxy-2-oxoglutarate aldolase
MNDQLEPLLKLAPVVPVLVIDDVQSAVALGKALVAGGLPLLEVTLRTPAALDVIEALSSEVEGAVVGAGTVLNATQLDAAASRGARFAVSPGVTETLLDAAEDSPVPLLPGTANASDVMCLLERGYRFMKFFPAEPAGGIDYLQALASPLSRASFCPTGGIGLDNARYYLALPNVICVGGSWVAPRDAVKAGDWGRIEALAREAAAITVS